MADEENKMKAEAEESKTEAAEEVAQETQAASTVEQQEKAKAEAQPADAQAMANKQEEEKKQMEEKVTAEKKETKKPTKDLAPKLAKIATEIEGLTVLELSELAGYLEEKFGVTAMAVAAPAAGGAAPAAAEPTQEKSTFNVILKDAGANKLAVIKAVREVKPDLGLMDAKKLVESAPKEVVSGVKKDDAQEAKKKIEDAGGTVELQ